MTIASVKDYRAALAKYHRSIVENNDPLIVTGPRGGDIVVLSKKDFDDLELSLKILRDKPIVEGLVLAQKRLSGDIPPFKTTEQVFTDVLES
jgi:PHD/YefM family antitoxin component YafN of YafNO toxin-antitoxin module